MIVGETIATGAVVSPFTHRHILKGSVTVDGAGAPRRVMVFERGTMVYVASTVATSDGSWEISGLPEYPSESLIVISTDDTNKTFNAEVADFISQVATV